MANDLSPQLGGQSDVTGREPELSGARPVELGECQCGYCQWLRGGPSPRIALARSLERGITAG